MMRDILAALLILGALLLIRRYVAEPVRVKGSSMLPTLQNGQWLWVDHLSYLRGDPGRGDVVICYYPGRYLDPWKLIRSYFVKRVVGLPGETVEIRQGVVHIDGRPLAEDYLDKAHTRFPRTMAPVILGEGEYFVLGDNRDNSNDSRRVGPIARSMVVGRVVRVILPPGQGRALSGR